MFPEMVGKKIFTENNKEIGTISKIRPDEFGSFIAIIETNYSEYPKLEIPVTRLRKTIKDDIEQYVLPESAIPLKLKMIIEKEEVEEIEVPTEPGEIPPAPEVPPIEKFLEKKEEIPETKGEEAVEAEVKEIKEVEEIKQPSVTEEEEAHEETKVEEAKVEEVTEEEEEKKPGGIAGIIHAIINAIKRLFSRG